MKKYIFILLAFALFTSQVDAEYVLPYPSFMPGNKMYKVSSILDKVQEYWHWGNIAKANYFLSLSDKKLVEAKILFEYKQYLLAAKALTQSNSAFQKFPLLVEQAFKEGKDIQELVVRYKEASAKHQETLTAIGAQVPREFTWTPEKTEATTLKLYEELAKSQDIRQLSSLSLRSFDLCTRSISSTQDHERLYNSCHGAKDSFQELIRLEDSSSN